MNLVMAAMAFLAKLSADQRGIAFAKRDKTSPAAALAHLLTTPQIRLLLERLLLRSKIHPAFVCAWSRWRRAHQATAAASHQNKRHNMQL